MTLVALLRGINVGKAKRIAMADLRKLLEGLGYRDVKTLLNSGNVVFTSSKDDAKTAGPRIEKALESRLGVASRVTVVTGSELAAVVAGDPFAKTATNPSRYLVAFFPDAAAIKALAPIVKERWHPEAIATGRRVAYVWCPESILQSPVYTALTRVAKEGVTARNWATVTACLPGPENSGRYCCTGASRSTSPRSTSRSSRMEVTTFVREARSKMASSRIGTRWFSGSTTAPAP